jgi:hypothetical protein
MTALQVIIKEAKAIRKKMPKMEWKKAVAQASAIYASKHKGKSPVGKKKVVKKAAKKKAGKKVGVIKKKSVKKTATKRKPTEKTVLKSIKKAVSVQKAHMSGLGAVSAHIINDVKLAHQKLITWQRTLMMLENVRKNTPAEMKKYNMMDIKRVKEHIKEIKTHISQLKKQIK